MLFIINSFICRYVAGHSCHSNTAVAVGILFWHCLQCHPQTSRQSRVHVMCSYVSVSIVQYPAAECATQRAVPFHQFYGWDWMQINKWHSHVATVIFFRFVQTEWAVDMASSVHLFWLHAGEGPGLQGCYPWCAEESVPQNTQDQTQQTF